MALSPERQSARMSKIKNGGLDQYGAAPPNSSNLEQLVSKGLISRLHMRIPRACSYSLPHVKYVAIIIITLFAPLVVEIMKVKNKKKH